MRGGRIRPRSSSRKDNCHGATPPRQDRAHRRHDLRAVKGISVFAGCVTRRGCGVGGPSSLPRLPGVPPCRSMPRATVRSAAARKRVTAEPILKLRNSWLGAATSVANCGVPCVANFWSGSPRPARTGWRMIETYNQPSLVAVATGGTGHPSAAAIARRSSLSSSVTLPSAAIQAVTAVSTFRFTLGLT